MGKVYTAIDAKIQRWMAQQQVFFVGTAPLDQSGSVNLSPKGHDTLRVLDEHTLAFLDYGGSGVETIAHVRENGRIVIMMCAFDGPPKIYRFHGEGSVVTPVDPGYDELAATFDRSELGVRSIIRINVTRVSDSCGFGVPLYEFREQRGMTPKYIRDHGVDKISKNLEKQNAVSIDGLPGMSSAEARAYRAPED